MLSEAGISATDRKGLSTLAPLVLCCLLDILVTEEERLMCDWVDVGVGLGVGDIRVWCCNEIIRRSEKHAKIFAPRKTVCNIPEW